MAIECTGDNLAELAACFTGLSPTQQQAIQAYLLCQVANSASSPLVYRALMTQTGTSAPVATVLENTIGEIVWTYNAIGNYIGTLSGAFPVGSTFIMSTVNAFDLTSKVSLLNETANYVRLATYDELGPANNLLDLYPVEILVYP